MPSSGFRLFGFPVHIRPGFLVLMALIVFINGAAFGGWLAVFLALFTLLHELGHAFAARATGARAEIALDFLYGYAAFEPTRPLRRWERAGISFAGPAVQVSVSVAVLLALGVNPLVVDQVADASFAAQALWWAGPVIGMFNLIPVLPLDGGNIARVGLEYVTGRAADLMLAISIGLTTAAAVWLVVDPERRAWLVVVAFPLIAQLQLFFARRDPSDGAVALQAAEDHAWRTGEATSFKRGMRPSPWFEASVLVAHGRADDGRRRLLDAFADGSPARWARPSAAPLATMESLLALLGEPLPHGNPMLELETAGALAALADYPRSAAYAAACFQRRPSGSMALIVARAAAALGDRTTTIGWLRAAHSRERLHAGWERWPEFAAYRDDPEFAQLGAST
jgi:Zn-dependent protease